MFTELMRPFRKRKKELRESTEADFYLGSSDYVGEWATPRACWIEKKIRVNASSEYLLLEVFPLLVGGQWGSPGVSRLVISPHEKGTTFERIKYPFPVYEYSVSSNLEHMPDFLQPEQLEMVAWGELYKSPESALKAARRAQQP